MKLKEIRSIDIKLFQNNQLLYEGPISQAPSDLKEQDIKTIDFESNILSITI